MIRWTLLFALTGGYAGFTTLAGCAVTTIPGEPGDPGSPTGTGSGSAPPTQPTGPTGDDSARLFSASSPWNTPATGNVDPGSPTMTSSGMPGSLVASLASIGKQLDIAGTDDYPDYGIPVFEAAADAPRVAVKDTYGYWGGFSAVPLPSDAVPAHGTDHHLCIFDRANHTIWEFWEMTKLADGSWTAGAGVSFDTTGPGFQSGVNKLGARAYGGSAAAGLIRYADMQRGQIDHALAIAYNFTRGTSYARGLGVDGVTQNIASHNDNVADANRNTPANIPEGARLRLKASVDVASRCGENAACRTIGTALQTYGAYMVDTAGVTTLVAEALTDRGLSWTGLLRESDATAFKGDDFEILALPAQLTQAPQ